MGEMIDETDDDIVRRINERIKDAKQHYSEWRRMAIESYGFMATYGQWSDEDKATLEEANRPIVAFNRIARTINAVSGMEVQNRQEVRFIPRTVGASGVNQLLTGACKWVRDNCDAEDEESESFQDMLISGMGWTETRMDYETDADGVILIDRIDPLEMLGDETARKRNLDDARWVARIREMDDDEVKRRWPNVSETGDMTDFWMTGDSEPHDATNAWKYQGGAQGTTGKKTRFIVQYQEWGKEDYYRVLSQNGNIIEIHKDKYIGPNGEQPIDSNKHTRLVEYVRKSGLKMVKQTKRKYKQAFIAGSTLLEYEDSPCQEGFTFKCITGMRDRNRGIWFGLVELMKDPQRWANKWLSQIMHILNSNAKGGLLAEKDAFENIRKAEDEWAKADAITWAKPGALSQGKIQPKPPSPYPQGFDRLMVEAIQAINDTPGVSLETIGMANRNQPAYLEAQRKQSGLTVLAVFFDSLRRYRKEQGRLMAHYITEYISDGRLIRISGPQGAQYIPLLRDQLTMKYDIVVDDAPTSPNMKERTFAILMELMPQFAALGMKVPPEIIDYAPIPEDLSLAWKRGMQPDPQAMQMQQRQANAAITKDESQAALNYAKVDESGAKAQHDIAIAGWEQINMYHKMNHMQEGHEFDMVKSANNEHIKQQAFERDQARKDEAFIREQIRRDQANMAKNSPMSE